MMEAWRVTYSPAARDDLKTIYSYIAFQLKERQTARNQSNRIRNAIRSLDRFPNRHTAVEWEPWSSMGMRRLPVDNFLVFYLVNEEKHLVTVVRIFYGGRDIERLIQIENQ